MSGNDEKERKSLKELVMIRKKEAKVLVIPKVKRIIELVDGIDGKLDGRDGRYIMHVGPFKINRPLELRWPSPPSRFSISVPTGEIDVRYKPHFFSRARLVLSVRKGEVIKRYIPGNWVDELPTIIESLQEVLRKKELKKRRLAEQHKKREKELTEKYLRENFGLSKEIE